MNLGLDFRRGLDTLPDAIEKLAARVNVLWSKEHDPATGAHKVITADKLTLAGTPLIGPDVLQHPGGYPGDTTTFLRADGVFADTGAGTGDVTGPASSVNNSVALYSGTTGKVLKDASQVTIDPANGNMTVAGNLNVNGSSYLKNVDATDVSARQVGTLQNVNVGTYIDATGVIYARQGIQEYSRTQLQGTPIALPFNAADYAALSPLVWTVSAGNVESNVYALIGKQVTWCHVNSNSTLNGSPSSRLDMRIPGGYTPSQAVQASVTYFAIGGASIAVSFIIGVGNPWAYFYTHSGQNFPTGAFYLRFVVNFWVN